MEKFIKLLLLSFIFCPINGQNGTVVNVEDKDLGDFEELNVNINGTESKKVVIVNVINLKLTVDTTKEGIWVFLKSQTANPNSVGTSPSSNSGKVANLNDKDLPLFDTLNVTISSPQRKKINVLINGKVISLETRNAVSLTMKNSQDSNYNNIFYTFNSDGNNVNVKYHLGDSGSYSYSESDGEFDQEAFNRGMNHLQESMARMRENMQRGFPWNWN